MKRVSTFLIPLFLGSLLTMGIQKTISGFRKPSEDTLNQMFPDSPKIIKAERMNFGGLWIVGTVDEYGDNSIGVLKGRSPTFPVVSYSENSDGQIYVRMIDPNGTHIFMDEDCDGEIDTKTYIHDGTYYFYSSTNGYPASVKSEDTTWILIDGQYYKTQSQNEKFYIVRDGKELEVDRDESSRGVFKLK